jgi:hypothetical protein
MRLPSGCIGHILQACASADLKKRQKFCSFGLVGFGHIDFLGLKDWHYAALLTKARSLAMIRADAALRIAMRRMSTAMLAGQKPV